MRKNPPPLLPWNRVTGLSLLWALWLTGCAGQPPADLGSAGAGLSPCPSSPNCVSSLAVEDAQRVAPLRVSVKQAQAAAAIRAVIGNDPRARVTGEENGYVRSEFSSRLLGFVDDVEFWWADAQTIHVRSASRLGYSDFGVNRKRVETLRAQISERLP